MQICRYIGFIVLTGLGLIDRRTDKCVKLSGYMILPADSKIDTVPIAHVKFDWNRSTRLWVMYRMRVDTT